MPLRSLFPRNDVFYDLFVEGAEQVHRAAELMVELCSATDRRTEIIGAIREVEHKGDRTTRKMLKLLVTSFITPLDREDIHALASSMDNVIDYLDDAANSFQLLRVGQPIEEYLKLAQLLEQCTEVMVKVVTDLRSPKLHSQCRTVLPQIYNLESEGDGVHNRAMARLFSGAMDTLEVLKWKQLCDLLEDAMDECQRVANTVEVILLKSI